MVNMKFTKIVVLIYQNLKIAYTSVTKVVANRPFKKQKVIPANQILTVVIIVRTNAIKAN